MSAFVVVGASLAGLRAVESARAAGYTGPITWLGEEPDPPYDRPPLSKEQLLASPGEPAPPLRTAEQLAALDVDLHLGEAATALDPLAHRVITTAGSYLYRAAVIATGSRVRRIPGSTIPGVHYLRTAADVAALRDDLVSARRVAVVGAGFIGCEVAATLRSRGLEVTVIEALPAPLQRAVGDGAGAALRAVLQRHGVTVRCGVSVDDWAAGIRLGLSDGTTVPADVVVVGVGVQPNTEWLHGSGLELDNGVVCDPALGCGPDLAAAGDVARWVDPRWGRSSRLEHWTNANEQGEHAARTALGIGDRTPYSAIPFFWSDWGPAKLQLVGRSDGDESIVVGDPGRERFGVLFGNDGRLWGALTVGRPAATGRLRRLLLADADLAAGVELAEPMLA